MKSGKTITRMMMALIAVVVIFALGYWISEGSSELSVLDIAKRAAVWLERTAVHDDSGTAWPVVPQESQQIVDNLYAGSAGPVLFFLELYKATGEDRYLNIARSGADHLASIIPAVPLHGLYSGLSGIAFVLLEAWQTTGDETYHKAVLEALDRIQNEAQQTDSGVVWQDPTDIISGSSGTGLFLLMAAKELGDNTLLETAVAAGRDLLNKAMPAPGGLKWPMISGNPYIMPNFSHGTAGVSYFLASLYQATDNEEFLNAALEGARHLEALADTENGVFRVYHHQGEGEDLYYLGYCHGPTGTARFFYKLYEITGDPHWLERVRQSAEAIVQTDIPEELTPGFWNNVGICCGSAGVAEFLVKAYKLFDDERYLKRAQVLTEDLISRSSAVGNGLMWVQAEHRVRPDFLQAQTGLMQGASGIGLWLLELDDVEHGRPVSMILPDSPW